MGYHIPAISAWSRCWGSTQTPTLSTWSKARKTSTATACRILPTHSGSWSPASAPALSRRPLLHTANNQPQARRDARIALTVLLPPCTSHYCHQYLQTFRDRWSSLTPKLCREISGFDCFLLKEFHRWVKVVPELDQGRWLVILTRSGHGASASRECVSPLNCWTSMATMQSFERARRGRMFVAPTAHHFSCCRSIQFKFASQLEKCNELMWGSNFYQRPSLKKGRGSWPSVTETQFQLPWRHRDVKRWSISSSNKPS